jgi:hypothetical protein
MEDTFGTTATFTVGGTGSCGTYKVDLDTGREFEVGRTKVWSVRVRSVMVGHA